MLTTAFSGAMNRAGAKLSLWQQFVLLSSLLVSMGWSSQAAATLGCQINATPPASLTVNAGSNAGFSASILSTGACPATVSITFSLLSDTTGGAILPANQTGVAAPGTTNFIVTAGPSGGTAVVRATCVGCFNGPTTADFTVNANNVYAFTPTTPTTITTNQSTAFTLGTNLLVNGAGSGATYSTNFFRVPSGPSLATVVNSGAGNASTTNTINSSGAFSIEGRVVCPTALPGCPPAPIPFNVVVEPVSMTPISASAVTIAAGASTTLIARYGGTISNVNAAYAGVLTWAGSSSPPLGNGALSAGTGFNALGRTQIDFTATVPGVYTVTVSTNDTWSLDNAEIFTITVTAIVRTLTVSSGNGQSAPAGTNLPSLLVAYAETNGAAAFDAPINWTTTGGTLIFNPNSTITNGFALTSIGLTLPATAGPVTITATRADDGTAFATFTATATAAIVRTLTVSSGNGQTATPGSPLPAPLVVLAQNNAVNAPGITINWTTTGGTLSTASSVTSAGGLANIGLTMPAASGVVTITGTRADDATVFATFTANGVKLAGIPNLTPSQFALAIALDSICTNLNTLNSPTPNQIDFRTRCQELANNAALNPGDVVRALDALLPDTQAAQARASMLTASRQFETISARIAALRSGTQGASFDGLALQGANGNISLGGLVNSLTADAATPEVGADFQRWGFFASGTIGTGDANAAGVTPSFDFDIHGLTVGVDYRQSDKFIFGAAIGYTNQDTKLAPGQGGVDASGYTLSAYSTYFKDNSWYTDAIVTFGKNNYDLERRINYTIPDGFGGFTNVNQTARSDSGGDLMSLGATFGRDFQKGGWSIGPYGRVLYTRLNFDRIQESLVSSGPGAGLALIVEERSLDSLASVIGGKFTRAFSISWGVLTPHFQLEWEHEFNSDPGAVTARFVNDPTGTAIVLSDSPYDADYFRIGLGLSAIMSKGRSGFMYYDKTLGRDGITQDNLAIGFRMEF